MIWLSFAKFITKKIQVPLILVIYSKDKSVVSALCFRFESGGSAPCNLSSRWGQCSASCRDCFIPSQVVFGTHIWGGWVGPRIALDPRKRMKICCPPPRNFPTNLWSLSPQHTHYTRTFPPLSISSVAYRLHFWTKRRIFHNLLKLPPVSNKAVFIGVLWPECETFHSVPF